MLSKYAARAASRRAAYATQRHLSAAAMQAQLGSARKIAPASAASLSSLLGSGGSMSGTGRLTSPTSTGIRRFSSLPTSISALTDALGHNSNPYRYTASSHVLSSRRNFSSGPPGGGFSAGQSQPWINPDAQVPGQNLEQYGVDLTKMAKEGKLDPVIGRHDEIRRTLQILARRTKSSPVLIGEPGVGKTAIAEGLAQR